MAVTTVFPPFLPHDGKMAAADPGVTQKCSKHSPHPLLPQLNLNALARIVSLAYS